MERTGRIVTAAAALLAAVWLVSGMVQAVTFGKLFSIGLATAVLVDATVIRGLLMPAVMRLAGDANWWAPRRLRRLHDRLGFHHQHGAAPSVTGPIDPVPATTATP